MTDPLEGVNEKLKRAHEHIVNLEEEIALFFKDCDYPILGNEDFEALAEKVKYHAARPVPPRFSVITGEIVHHFRSCLDHIAWQLATPSARCLTPTKIEFPIFRNRLKKDGSPSLKGKIEFIASTTARDLIDRIQPYQGSDPLADTLWVIHDLDRIYKHRELMMAVTTFDLGPAQVKAITRLYLSYPSFPMSPEHTRQFKKHLRPTPQIALSEYCKGESHLVIPALSDLEGTVREVVGLFEVELRKC